MMGATEVVEEYENAKQLLNDEASDDKLQASVDTMQELCDTIREELSELAEKQQ